MEKRFWKFILIISMCFNCSRSKERNIKELLREYPYIEYRIREKIMDDITNDSIIYIGYLEGNKVLDLLIINYPKPYYIDKSVIIDSIGEDIVIIKNLDEKRSISNELREKYNHFLYKSIITYDFINRKNFNDSFWNKGDHFLIYKPNSRFYISLKEYEYKKFLINAYNDSLIRKEFTSDPDKIFLVMPQKC
ncbi:MAG: hypothetical protein ACK5MD_01240 [Flavobacteriales bacterium]